MSRSIPRMAWRLCTSSSLARRYCTLNGSPACNNATTMGPARRNAAAVEPARNNAAATYPPADRTRNVPAGRPHIPRTPADRTRNVPAGRTHAPRAGTPHARQPPERAKKRRYPQGAAAPRSVTQECARTCRGSRERTARPRRRPRTEQCQARAGRTSSYCQPCS